MSKDKDALKMGYLLFDAFSKIENVHKTLKTMTTSEFYEYHHKFNVIFCFFFLEALNNVNTAPR